MSPPKIKRDDYLPLTGSITESNPTPTASSLVQNTAAVANPNSTQDAVPLVSSSASDASSSTTPSSTSASADTSASSGSQIPIATVVGACTAALAALVLAVLLALYCSRRQKQFAARSKSRNVARNASRRRSHLEPWKRMDDGGDRHAGKEGQMSQRPPSGPLGAMFQRSLSDASGEKSSEGIHRESVGTMHHFAKYHPDLAAEMASQAASARGNETVTQPPPAFRFMGRAALDGTPPISWDGNTTTGGESFMSLHSSTPNSPSSVVAKATPPATSSSLHRWESAEVVHAGPSEDGEHRNPFADSASSIRSSTRGRNPFFGARDYPFRRPTLSDARKVPFVRPETPRDSDAAIRSLIAALQEPMLSNDRIVSIQSSLYSRMTADDADSAVSVRVFPYPPSQINNVR